MQQAQTQQLQTLTEPAFDQQYLSNEAQSNAQSISDGQQEASSGQNAAVLQLNSLLVPFQEQHLLQAQILQASETGGTPPASTQPTGSPGLLLAPNGALNAQDQTFIQEQASDNAAEIQAGQLAETQGQDPAVSVYGRWLVLDHTMLNAGLQQVAQAEGVTPSSTPDAQQAAQNAQLQGMTGSVFDMQYLLNETQGNIQGVGYLEQEIYNGADPALVALAQAALPLQEQHLAAAVQADVALTLGANDQSAAPGTAVGQLAAAIGNYTAQAVVAAAQALASPSNNGFVSASSSSSALFPSVPGSGASSLGALTAPGPSTGVSTAGAMLTLST
jgi:predicted outer membrane protein